MYITFNLKQVKKMGMNGTPSTPENLQNIFGFMNDISGLLNQTNNVALDSASNQAEMAYSMALQEAEGLAAQLQINDVVTGLNIQSDLSALGVRQSLMLASKAYEAATLIAQFREKTLGMFLAITEQRTNTTWGRTKQLTQGFKF